MPRTGVPSWGRGDRRKKWFEHGRLAASSGASPAVVSSGATVEKLRMKVWLRVDDMARKITHVARNTSHSHSFYASFFCLVVLYFASAILVVSTDTYCLNIIFCVH